MATSHLPVALRIAFDAHHDQVDKAGKPYLDHVISVAEGVAEHSADAIVAAVLHDVVEDSGTTLADLRAAGFPEAVVSAVDSVTRREGESYMDMIRRAAADPLGRVVKLSDNAHNSRPDRLAQLPAATAESLADRYARARSVLLEHR